MARHDRQAVPLGGPRASAPAFAPPLRDALIAQLSAALTPRRRERLEAVLARRTRRLTVVLEDLYQPHNASAVLRSCECFGLQEVHIVEARNLFKVNRDVALGASRWLDLWRWRAADLPAGVAPMAACCDVLEARGYRLVAATPDDRSVAVDDLDVTAGPLAVLFGTELEGLSRLALARADAAVHIPMHGFTESFNISVSAALILRELSRRLRASGTDIGLEADDGREVLLGWLRRTVTHSDERIDSYLQTEWQRDR